TVLPSHLHTHSHLFFFLLRRPPSPPLFPYTTLFRSKARPSRSARVRRSGRASASACPTPANPSSESAHKKSKNPNPTGKTNSARSEEHTSELQSRFDLVCRLLLEKKKKNS